MVGKGMLIKLNRDLYHIVPSSADANTYILSRDIALQIMKKERCLLSNALFHSANVYCFTNRSFYDLRLSDAVNNCICTG
jgi:hypothetical protein